jgi:tetratricopeptide (TPR) repeat protein
VLHIEPTCPEAVRSLAELALQEEDFDEAYDLYSGLVESGNPDSVVCYNTALLCQKRGLTSDAISLYRRALNLAPDFCDALLNLGHVLMSLGEEDEARSCFLSAAGMNAELTESAATA